MKKIFYSIMLLVILIEPNVKAKDPVIDESSNPIVLIGDIN